MVKHAQIICRQKPTNCFSVFDHFVNLARKGLKNMPNVLKEQSLDALSIFFSAEKIEKYTNMVSSASA